MATNTEVFKRSALTTVGLTTVMGIDMSSYLHRGQTHGGVEYNEGVQRVGEFLTWALSGMTPLEWQVTHLTHHAFQDTEPTSEQWELIQAKYPGAPIEVFRDPHSPILEGHLNILFKNGIVYYPKAAKQILSYLRNLEAQDVPRDEWPPHLRHVNIEQSSFERSLNKIPHSRMAGLVLTGLGITALRGRAEGLTTMAMYIPAILSVGAAVNSFGHTGKTDTFSEKVKVILGLKKAVPDENGSYASNFFKGLEFLTAGEASHKKHHDDPRNPFITSETNYLRDPSSGLIKLLAYYGLAKVTKNQRTKKPKNYNLISPYDELLAD